MKESWTLTFTELGLDLSVVCTWLGTEYACGRFDPGAIGTEKPDGEGTGRAVHPCPLIDYSIQEIERNEDIMVGHQM